MAGAGRAKERLTGLAKSGSVEQGSDRGPFGDEMKAEEVADTVVSRSVAAWWRARDECPPRC
jgi:hypothetical protein